MGLKEKPKFGELIALEFDVGDIVEWRMWENDSESWVSNYGVLLDVKNEIRSDRVVSISRVMPLNEPHIELEFFTLSLKAVYAK